MQLNDLRNRKKQKAEKVKIRIMEVRWEKRKYKEEKKHYNETKKCYSCEGPEVGCVFSVCQTYYRGLLF